MKHGPLIAVILASVSSLSAGIFGSLFWRDIDGVAAANKPYLERILSDFDIACVGEARMINRAENVKLNGARIGPYNFPASLREGRNHKIIFLFS